VRALLIVLSLEKQPTKKYKPQNIGHSSVDFVWTMFSQVFGTIGFNKGYEFIIAKKMFKMFQVPKNI